MSYVNDEKSDFVATLRASSPDASTLCAGWRVRDLVAHLVLRERSLRYVVGNESPVERLRTQARNRQQAFVDRQTYAALVARFEQGPPIWSPFSWPGLKQMANQLEYVVHHEDVRRAAKDWQPRALPLARQRAVWTSLRGAARTFLRGGLQDVVLRWADSPQPSIAGKTTGGPVVTVSGDPVDVALFVFGRGRAAHVELDGPDDAVRRLRESKD